MPYRFKRLRLFCRIERNPGKIAPGCRRLQYRDQRGQHRNAEGECCNAKRTARHLEHAAPGEGGSRCVDDVYHGAALTQNRWASSAS